MIELQECPTEIQTCQEEKKKYVCRVCKEKTDNFYPANIRNSNFICKKCNDERNKILRNSIKRKCVEYKGGKCCVCGYCKFQGSLDFHHINPSEKDFGIASMKMNSFETLKPELDKCALLCKNCHAEVHAGLIDLNKIGSPAGI